MKVPEKVDRILKEFGMSSTARICYWYLAKHEHSTATTIAEATGLSRTQVYPALKQLQTKGFVHSFKTNLGGPTYFSGNHAEQAINNYIYRLKSLALELDLLY